MKILQSCCSKSWGGLEIIALKTSLLLKNNGHDVHLICPKDSELEKRASNQCIKTIPIWNNTKSVILPAKKLSRLFKTEKYCIVHTHLSHDLWTIVPALKFSRSSAKLFLSKHMGSGVSKKDFFHRYLYNRVNRIFAVSSYVKQSVIDTCPVDKAKVNIIFPGLNLENYEFDPGIRNALRKDFGIEDKSIVITMAGRMSPGKGHEEFLKATAILKKEYGTKIKFLIAGSASYGEDKYESEIIRLAADLNVNDITVFTGFRNDIPQILSASDIFVFPSHEESFGITLTEAMAVGLPAAASKNAGVLDIVAEDITGLLFPPKDAARLAETVKTLIDNKDLRESMGKAGKKRAMEIFNEKDELRILEEYYAE